MAKTSIEWTEFSVNPIRYGKGHYCQKISSGCANCYASTMQTRFNNPPFGGTSEPVPQIVPAMRGDFDQGLWLDESKLQDVLRRKKPTTYFWCDMTDLFGDWVPDEWIDKCFATMALTPHHTHQVLTKRAERMRQYLGDEHRYQAIHESIKQPMGYDNPKRPAINRRDLPLPNVWLGTSVEDQKRADERIPHLLKTPAAVRFLSIEPLLGKVNLDAWLPSCCERGSREDRSPCPICVENGRKYEPSNIHWVIVGGESGRHARAMNIQWARDIVNQCQAAGVACFVKQFGANIECRNDMVSDWLDECGISLDDVDNDRVRMQGDPVRVRLHDRKGGDMAEWPEDLRIREMPK